MGRARSAAEARSFSSYRALGGMWGCSLRAGDGAAHARLGTPARPLACGRGFPASAAASTGCARTYGAAQGWVGGIGWRRPGRCSRVSVGGFGPFCIPGSHARRRWRPMSEEDKKCTRSEGGRNACCVAGTIDSFVDTEERSSSSRSSEITALSNSRCFQRLHLLFISAALALAVHGPRPCPSIDHLLPR